MPSPRKTRDGGKVEARSRLRRAQDDYDTASEIAGRSDRPGTVTSLAVLSGIASSDAICYLRLGQAHRGEDHRDATRLLETATPDGKQNAKTLGRLLELKGTAHYGETLISTTQANNALKWARQLLERAQAELEK